jgi:PITH domain
MIRFAKFQSVANLDLQFPNNFRGDTTRIYFIGLRGEATEVLILDFHFCFSCKQIILCWSLILILIPWQLKREVVATIVYEVMPNLYDHKWALLTWSQGCNLYCNRSIKLKEKKTMGKRTEHGYIARTLLISCKHQLWVIQTSP